MTTRSGRLRGSTALATTYGGGDADLLERVVPLVDIIEVAPDAITVFDGDRWRLDAEVVAALRDVSADVRIVAHGFALSIGSASGRNADYLGVLDELFAAVDIAWHSEHLGFTHVDGEDLRTMVAVPRTEEALDIVAPRVATLQQRYGVPFLLENIADLLPDPGGEYSHAGFLNELAHRTGCGVLLDLYNLECDAHNHGRDVASFIGELDLSAVREVHVACGVEYRGFLLDVHSRPTRPSTVALAADVVDRAPHLAAVTYELLAQAVPVLGSEGVAAELVRLHTELGERVT